VLEHDLLVFAEWRHAVSFSGKDKRDQRIGRLDHRSRADDLFFVSFGLPEPDQDN
jgi:hypothetical protein